ncbi:MAG: glutaredoxin family protein [Alphaproteobacteria bacterium]|nr:glutaredoxin family protein [Alphaproteobacteria bacterium]
MIITVFTSPTCHFCHDVKKFFDDKKIAYTEISVTTPEARNQLIELSGQLGVPVTVFKKNEKDSGSVVVGYDPKNLTKLIESSSNSKTV